MGRKRTRTGKYFYLCIIGLISVLFFISCASVENSKNLLRSDKLLAEGDYEGALEENRKLLSKYVDKPPADLAIFNMGLIYAHYGNPDRDYKKSFDFFWRLIRDFPQSSKIEEAKIWIGVLNTIEETKLKFEEKTEREEVITKEEEKIEKEEKQKNPKNLFFVDRLMAKGDYERALEENQKLLSKYLNKPPGDEVLYNMGIIYAQLKNYTKARNSFKRLVKDFPSSSRIKEAKIWLEVLNVIEETKQIDLDIEEKKKELIK